MSANGKAPPPITMADVERAGISVAYQAGQAVAVAKNKTADYIQQNQLTKRLADTAQAAKATFMQTYEAQTGRSAALDGTILKYTAVAGLGATAMSALPAVGFPLGLWARVRLGCRARHHRAAQPQLHCCSLLISYTGPKAMPVVAWCALRKPAGCARRGRGHGGRSHGAGQRWCHQPAAGQQLPGRDRPPGWE
jgi:hypothetical protein